MIGKFNERIMNKLLFCFTIIIKTETILLIITI